MIPLLVGLVLFGLGLGLFVGSRRASRFRLALRNDAEHSRTCVRESMAGSHVRKPRPFRGSSREFNEWAFSVQLYIRSNKIPKGNPEVNLAASFLEGNALLWFISTENAGIGFEDWSTMKAALAENFGPVHDEDDNRLALFALSQSGSLRDYIEEFSRLCLCLSDLDERSKALLFVRGLCEDLRRDTMKEHPTTLSEAIRAARLAQQCEAMTLRIRKIGGERTRSRLTPPGVGEQKLVMGGGTRTRRFERRTKLTEMERATLLREGRCFKCRQAGHLAKDCLERESSNPPNEDRQ